MNGMPANRDENLSSPNAQHHPSGALQDFRLPIVAAKERGGELAPSCWFTVMDLAGV
jgi:hypothetical protein